MSESESKPKCGRPSSYKPEYVRTAKAMCKLGATEAELADAFGVTRETINQWSLKHQAFADALKMGKEPADERVQRRLYERATGYTYEAVKIFMPAGASEPVYAPYKEHVPPDTTACIFWLKNRRPDLWRDRPAEQVQDDIADAIRREAQTQAGLFANGEVKH